MTPRCKTWGGRTESKMDARVFEVADASKLMSFISRRTRYARAAHVVL